jgi:hypothetical protein
MSPTSRAVLFLLVVAVWVAEPIAADSRLTLINPWLKAGCIPELIKVTKYTEQLIRRPDFLDAQISRNWSIVRKLGNPC